MAANRLESRGKGRAELRLDVLIHNHADPTACTAQLPVVPPAPLSQDENCVCLFPRTDSIPQQKKIPRHGMHMNILQLTREMVSRIVGGEWSVFISLGELFSTEEVM